MNYFDLHCDTATEAAKANVGVSHNGLQLDLAKLQTGRLCQSYAVFIPDTPVSYTHLTLPTKA